MNKLVLTLIMLSCFFSLGSRTMLASEAPLPHLNHDDLKELIFTLYDFKSERIDQVAAVKTFLHKNPVLIDHMTMGTPIKKVYEDKLLVGVEDHFIYELINKTIMQFHASLDQDIPTDIFPQDNFQELRTKFESEYILYMAKNRIVEHSILLPLIQAVQVKISTILGGLRNSHASASMLDQATLIIKNAEAEKRPELLDFCVESFFPEKLDLSELSREIDIKNLPATQIMLSEDGISANSLPVSIKSMLDVIMQKYFDHLEPPMQLRLIKSLLDLPLKASKYDQLLSIVQSSGVVLQKLFQLIGKETDSEELANLMEKLNDKIPPMPGDQALEQIASANSYLLPEQNSVIFDKFKKKAIASATIGSVYLANCHERDTELAIKVLRSGIYQQTIKELDMLKSITETEFQLGIINEIEEAILLETNFLKEFENMQRGKVYNKPEKGISTVKAHRTYVPNNTYIAMEKASGKAINSYSDEDISSLGFTKLEFVLMKKKAVANLFKLWLNNAIYGDGFFHADLHGGNIFFSADKNDKPKFLLTLLDFGNVGQLNCHVRAEFVKFSAGIILHHPITVWEALKSLTTSLIGDEEAKEIKQKIVNIIGSKLPIPVKADKILFAAADSYVQMPVDLLNFTRGKLFLEKLMDQINAELDEEDPQGFHSRLDMSKIFMKTLISKTISEHGRHTLRLKSSSPLPLAPSQEFSIALRKLRDSFRPRSYATWIEER